MRVIDGTIAVLRCENCGATFPHFVYSGDEDTDTEGLCSASTCHGNEVVLVEADAAEWRDIECEGARSIERRLEEQLGYTDLKILRVVEVEQARAPAGTSFTEFRKSYRPPTLIYTCACCAVGKSRSVAELTVDNFQRGGGLITTTGRLALRPI